MPSPLPSTAPVVVLAALVLACSSGAPPPAAEPTAPAELDDPPAAIDSAVEPYVFTRNDVAPPPKDIPFEHEGRTLAYRIMDPPGQYRDMALPAWPQFVPVGGELPPTRRIVRYSAQVNELGLRGEGTPARDKPEGVFRIAVLGTGVTFGEGVEDDEVYAVRLEEKLRADPRLEGAYEVINLGAPSVTGELVPGIFHYQGSVFTPDFWVIAFGVNDALPMFKQSRRGYRQVLRDLMDDMERAGTQAVFLVEPANSFYPWKAEYLDYMAIFAEEVEGRFPVIDAAGMLDCHERDEGVRLVLTGEEQRVVRYRQGQPELLFSVRHQAAPGEPTIAPSLNDWMDSHEVSLRTFITDVHLTPLGHELLAGSLHRWIAHRLLHGEPPAPEPSCALWD